MGKGVTIYTVENLDCAACAAKLESRLRTVEGVEDLTLTYATKQLRIRAKDPAALLPERHDFVAVWRYLAANAQDGRLLDELGCLSRKITRQTGSLCTCGRLRICLDVFCEQKLLSLRAQRGAVQIALCLDGHKADLESSSILARLKKAKDR